MPLFESCQIPPPRNWQELENLCLDLWGKDADVKGIKKNGRNGQKQNGADLIYWKISLDGYAAVQCKCIDSADILKINELKNEIELAKFIDPKIKHFSIVTTGKKDVRLEKTCREITDQNIKMGLFSVEILAWEDIIHLLSNHPNVAKKHYPFLCPVTLSNSMTDHVSNWRNSKYSFTKKEFIHPLIVKELIGWISDKSETVLSIDLCSANKSNQFHGEIVLNDNEEEKLWVSCRNDETREHFSYSHIGASESGIHMLHCAYCGGGSGVFHSIIFLVIQGDESIEIIEQIPTIKKREILNTLGYFSLGDRYFGKIFYEDGYLHISRDESSMPDRISNVDKVIEVK